MNNSLKSVKEIIKNKNSDEIFQLNIIIMQEISYDDKRLLQNK